MESPDIQLQTLNLTLTFGGITALNNVSLDVYKGELLAVIGPNGAGKTCLLNSISGYYRPQQGRIFFNDRPISTFPVHRRAKLGIARTFQNIALFTGLTTLENLMAARHVKLRPNPLAGADKGKDVPVATAEADSSGSFTTRMNIISVLQGVFHFRFKKGKPTPDPKNPPLPPGAYTLKATSWDSNIKASYNLKINAPPKKKK